MQDNLLPKVEEDMCKILAHLEENNALIPSSVFADIIRTKETLENMPLDSLTLEGQFVLVQLKMGLQKFQEELGILMYPSRLMRDGFLARRFNGILGESDRGPSSDKAEHSGDS